MGMKSQRVSVGVGRVRVITGVESLCVIVRTVYKIVGM